MFRSCLRLSNRGYPVVILRFAGLSVVSLHSRLLCLQAWLQARFSRRQALPAGVKRAFQSAAGQGQQHHGGYRTDHFSSFYSHAC